MRRMWHGMAAALLLAGSAVAQDTITAHGISAFGDLKYPADFARFDHANPDAPRGGTMSFRGTGASTTFDSVNPFILAGEPAQGLGLLHDTLLIAAEDEPDAAYGLIAESLEYPPGREWVIFTLREGARFSDGTPVTAADVVWTHEALVTMGEPSWRIRLADIASVTALDDRRVRFDFREGAATRDLPNLAGSLPVLPKHYYATVAFDRSTIDPPVSSGAFRIRDVQPGRSITYCRDPDYWGAALPVNLGRHNFACYRYEYYTDNTVAFEAFKSGGYLMHEEFSSALWATNYDFPALSAGHVIRTELPDARPSGTQGFWLNLRREKFQDPRVREALGMAFNFEWSNQTLFYGLYDRTDSFWENSDLQAQGPIPPEELAILEPFRDQLPAAVFDAPAFVPPVLSADEQIDRATLRRAGALLDDAGWTTGADGLRRNAAGEVLEVVFLDDNPAFERIVLPYIQNLERMGVAARLDMVDPAQGQERQQRFDYDITPGRLVMSLSPSVELRTLFGTDGAAAEGSLNLSGVADPVVDALIEQIIAADSREEMAVRVRALDRVLRAMHIWVPNWYKGSHWVAHWNVFGMDEKPAYARGDTWWWFDQPRFDALQAAGVLR
ncbi:MAG: extracellular solute-binding protein [Rhodobacteraceae bacterium]|nr:extracellular solute-binding protein [Paracoccaceae bacterium]